MSKKSAKWRQCPAVSREINSAECGEKRGSVYQCPATCGYNPFAPQNYDNLLDLESEVDSKCMTRLKEEVARSPAFGKTYAAAANSTNSHAVHVHYTLSLFFERGEDGLTRAERWEKSGFPGLKNDERVLLRAKMKIRIVLLEVHRVINREQIEAVDLLSSKGDALLLQDRSLAALVFRFSTSLNWAYRFPIIGEYTARPR